MLFLVKLKFELLLRSFAPSPKASLLTLPSKKILGEGDEIECFASSIPLGEGDLDRVIFEFAF